MNDDQIASAMRTLIDASRRLAAAERALVRGWDWRSCEGAVEAFPVTEVQALVSKRSALMELAELTRR